MVVTRLMFGLPETALAKFELCASFSDAFFRRRANFTATPSRLAKNYPHIVLTNYSQYYM